MTRVYVDLETLSTADRRTPDRSSIEALEHLTEAGHDVFVVAAASRVADDLARKVRGVVIAAPHEPDERAWYLTSEVGRCIGRSARLTTVLVGVTLAPTAIHRCDRVARDVRSAMLEILAAEAMGGARH